MIIITTGVNRIVWQNDCVREEAGYSLRRLAREAAPKGLSGLEFACGIPGNLHIATVRFWKASILYYSYIKS